MFTFGLVGVSAQGTDGTCDSIEFDDEAGFSSFRIAVGEWLCHQGVSIDDWWSVIGEEFCGIGEVINPYNWECLEVSAFVSDTDLATTESAVLWLYLWLEIIYVETRLKVSADTSFDVEEYDLDVFVFLNDRQSSFEYCNSFDIFAEDPPVVLSCSAGKDGIALSDVTVVRATHSISSREEEHFRCEKNIASSEDELAFACTWR